MLELPKHRRNGVLELEAPLLQSFEHLVGGRLLFRLYSKNGQIDLVVASDKIPELVTAAGQLLDEGSFLRKLFAKIVRNAHFEISSTHQATRARAVQRIRNAPDLREFRGSTPTFVHPATRSRS